MREAFDIELIPVFRFFAFEVVHGGKVYAGDVPGRLWKPPIPPFSEIVTRYHGLDDEGPPRLDRDHQLGSAFFLKSADSLIFRCLTERNDCSCLSQDMTINVGIVGRDEREKDPYVRDRDISTLTQPDRSWYDQDIRRLLIVLRCDLGSARILLYLGSTRLEPRAI